MDLLQEGCITQIFLKDEERETNNEPLLTYILVQMRDFLIMFIFTSGENTIYIIFDIFRCWD